MALYDFGAGLRKATETGSLLNPLNFIQGTVKNRVIPAVAEVGAGFVGMPNPNAPKATPAVKKAPGTAAQPQTAPAQTVAANTVAPVTAAPIEPVEALMAGPKTTAGASTVGSSPMLGMTAAETMAIAKNQGQRQFAAEQVAANDADTFRRLQLNSIASPTDSINTMLAKRANRDFIAKITGQQTQKDIANIQGDTSRDVAGLQNEGSMNVATLQNEGQNLRTGMTESGADRRLGVTVESQEKIAQQNAVNMLIKSQFERATDPNNYGMAWKGDQQVPVLKNLPAGRLFNLPLAAEVDPAGKSIFQVPDPVKKLPSKVEQQ